MPFEGPQAPGHGSGGSLCPRGGLDRFWDRFWEPNGAKKEPKCIKKSMQKSMKFGVRFYTEIRPKNGAKMEAKTHPNSIKNT